MENIEEKKMITGYNFLVLMDFSELIKRMSLMYQLEVIENLKFATQKIFWLFLKFCKELKF